jgi:hypothetical protein
MAAPTIIASGIGVEEAPGDGSDFVEKIKDGLSAADVDGASLSKETKVGVNFLRRTVGDSLVVHPVPAGSSVTFCQVSRNR